MEENFSRTITLLRKEKGITQKQGAMDLGVSQGLLSHYEKGIREPGLSFVVKVAKYYGVSCDYLLGVSPQRQGEVLNLGENTETQPRENMIKGGGSILPLMNKKLLVNSIHIIFDLLSKANHPGLVTEVSQYFMLSIYRIFRMMYSSCSKNPSEIFALSKSVHSSYIEASIRIREGNIQRLLDGEKVGKSPKMKEEDKEVFYLSHEKLQQEYHQYGIALLNLLQNAETGLEEWKNQE